MSSDPTISEVKRMLDSLLRNSRPKHARINKQKEIDETLERIQVALIKACAKYGPKKHIIESILESYRTSGVIERWVVHAAVDCTFEECFIVRVKFGLALKHYDIQINFHDY